MKLRNKLTGEIAIFGEGIVDLRQIGCKNVAEMYEAGWTDYEEPKEDGLDNIITLIEAYNNYDNERYPKEIVEKLKAWKRLKDKGFVFCGHDDRDRGQLGDIVIYAKMPTFEYDDDSTRDDLDICFGGEE